MKGVLLVEILFFVISVLVGVLTEGVAVKVNMAGLGIMVEIALVGAVILWNIRHNKKCEYPSEGLNYNSDINNVRMWIILFLY